jgi:predicted glycosyltransferase
MEKNGHEILINASEKDLTYTLLDTFGFDYIKIGSYGNSLFQKITRIPQLDLKLYRAVKKVQPDIFIGTIRAAHVSRLLRKPVVIFDDDEYGYYYNYPFADAIIGLTGFKKTGKKVIKIDSFKELAYLHPNYYKPRTDTLSELGISKNEDFVLLRFVAWSAYHDVLKKGFDHQAKKKLIKASEEYASVFISSEERLPKDFEKYRLPVSSEKIHDVLYSAKLLISDSQTMTTEAAILGTPAIRSNSFVGKKDMGNFIELEQKYHLIHNYRNSDEAIEKAIETLQNSHVKEKWREKKERLLNDKIDITKFMIWFIQRYPESLHTMREHPPTQYLFR